MTHPMSVRPCVALSLGCAVIAVAVLAAQQQPPAPTPNPAQAKYPYPVVRDMRGVVPTGPSSAAVTTAR